MIEVDPDRPGVRGPDASRSARSTTEPRPTQLAAERGWTFKPDGDRLRRVVPSPAPKRIFEHRQIRWLLEPAASSSAPAAAASRPPTTPDGSSLGVEAVIDKDHASGLLARDIDADVFDHGHRHARGVRRVRHSRTAGDRAGAPRRAPGRARRRVRRRLDAAQGHRRLRLRPRHRHDRP